MQLHPVDWFNYFGIFKDIFTSVKIANLITDSECALFESEHPNRATFKLSGYEVQVLQSEWGFTKGTTISKFTLLCAAQFKHSQQAAISYIQHELMGEENPFIRVGTDYYKVISKSDRYGGIQIHIKPWKKDEIKQDHSKTFMASIPKFDDFIIIPDNKTHTPIANNCYNLYSKFSHLPFEGEVSTKDIPHTMRMLAHIFGEQLQLGLKYMKVLYEYPKQILPILTLVSQQRDTGKTTFLNWNEMIFGSNSILISPEDLLKHFNSAYSTKNIIMVDETFVEKQSGVEKLKFLSTTKSISVSQKFVQEYSIPFFGKVIICTNKVKDFMRIDSEEIRFWIRKVPPITGEKNTRIEEDLFNEIPKFLKLLIDLPEIDFSKSRMVFTQEEIETDELNTVKSESRSGLHKELEILIQDYFDKYQCRSFYATASDIKSQWFHNNNQVSIAYLKQVLTDQMKIEPLPKRRYNPFDTLGRINTKVSTPYHFINPDPEFIDSDELRIEESQTGIL